MLNVLLQILDEGTLTDGKGRTVSFKNCIFVMTSNIGSKEIIDHSRGENNMGEKAASIGMSVEGVVKSILEKNMKPELLNRIDEIVVFKSLDDDILKSIANNILDETVTRAAAEQDMTVTVTDEFTKMVVDEGASTAAQFGARPMRRAAKRFLEDTLSEAIMREFLNEGDEVLVDIDRESVTTSALLDGEKKTLVKITRVTNGNDSILIPVESDGGIGVIEAKALDPLRRAMPPLPDDDGFQ